MKTDIAARLAGTGATVRPAEPLKNHTTFRIGGPAAFFVTVDTPRQLAEVRVIALTEHKPLFIIGGGSNLLAPDKGYAGVVAKLGGAFTRTAWEEPAPDGTVAVECGAGVSLTHLVKESLDRQCAGLEGCAGIPGTVGGALVGNAGTADGWIGAAVAAVDVLGPHGEPERLDRAAVRFDYRSSDLAGRIVLGARFSLKKLVENGTVIENVQAALDRRRSTQPLGDWSAGCVFKNPPGDSAGRLIDACGLKGMQFGGARISPQHANFIVNTGSATAEDVLHLVRLAHEAVKGRFSVDLSLEIKILG